MATITEYFTGPYHEALIGMTGIPVDVIKCVICEYVYKPKTADIIKVRTACDYLSGEKLEKDLDKYFTFVDSTAREESRLMDDIYRYNFARGADGKGSIGLCLKGISDLKNGIEEVYYFEEKAGRSGMFTCHSDTYKIIGKLKNQLYFSVCIASYPPSEDEYSSPLFVVGNYSTRFDKIINNKIINDWSNENMNMLKNFLDGQTQN